MTTETQVITFDQNGSVEGLQHKRGFDLRKLGTAKIERVSEVLFDEASQKWYVKFLRGELAGRVLTAKALMTALVFPEDVIDQMPAAQVALFKEYDEGVRAEVETLNYIALKAGTFAVPFLKQLMPLAD